MLPLKKILKTIESGLDMLTQRTKDMQRMLDNLEDALVSEKVKTGRVAKPKSRVRKAATASGTKKKPVRETATGLVLRVIKNSKDGVTTERIKAKTGFDEKKIWGIINRLKKQGKVKSAGRGVYMKL